MNDKNIIDLKLPLGHVSGKEAFESVPAEALGEGVFKILASPGFAPGFAAGDEVEISGGGPNCIIIKHRGGNVCVQIFFKKLPEDDRSKIDSEMSLIGGWLDGGKEGIAGHLLIYTIPIRVGFKRIENVMERIADRFSVDRWMYGNVYDTRDGVTPLNWWVTESKQS